MSKEVAEEYLSSLADLTVNSKPLINMLTMLADENVDHAPAIVQVIENHLEKVPPEVKLPILYLIDSIIKNVSKVYVPLFTQNIVNVFVSVFEKVDETTRLNMYKLRQTWADVFPARKLYVLDLRVKDIDHAWPVTAPTPTSIHFNPKFLGNKSSVAEVPSGTTALSRTTPSSSAPTTSSSESQGSDLREQLLKKQQELIGLQQKKLRLMQTKAMIEGQENQLRDNQNLLDNIVRPPITEEAAKLFSQRAAAKPKAVVLPPSTSANKIIPAAKTSQSKTKIAPANTQLIEAAKSRDPRIARQQQQNKASLEVTHKEQEIYHRQLAMLKTPVVEQVAPVVPAQKVLSDSNVKSHITFNVQNQTEKNNRLDAKNKKRNKETIKNDSSKNKSKQMPSKEFKSSPKKSSKNITSKSSKNFSSRNSQRRNLLDRSKTPPKNERSVSPRNQRHISPRNKAVETLFSSNDKNPDDSVSLDLELIESSPSPEPPPPPIISRSDEDSICEKKDETDLDEISEDEKETKNELTGFKDVKGVSKGRNYIRRNREKSASPKEISGDIDLRVSDHPDKQMRLLYEDEKTNVVESKKLSESLVNVSGKDVDLRLLTIRSGSPNKKRLSTEKPIEEPPKKKNKFEILDELFGSEDVDLRKMNRGIINHGDRLPSPPPPPVISNGPIAPQIATIAPLMVAENSKQILDDSVSNELQRENQVPENVIRDRENYDSNRRGRRTWTDIKAKPEAEIKPLSLSSRLELELDQRKDLPFSHYDSPEKGGKRPFRERLSPRGELDRLGRPLLYNKLPKDPRARRESLGILDGRDTDMRRFENLMDRDHDTNINVNMIVAQAADQVRNGTMTVQEYNELLKQVIQVNEKQKLREAQNKSRQEIRRTQHHYRNRRSPNRFGPPGRNNSPFRPDEERQERRPFNDIDERLQMPWRSMQQSEGAGFNRMGYMGAPNRTTFDISDYEDRSIKTETCDDDTKRFRNINDFDNTENRLRDVMCNERTHDCVDVPSADPKALELISKDPMKSINIDGTARDIRFYGDTAIVMLSWDDPKEISFEDGIRRVAIGDLSIVCALNDSYIMFMLNGNTHRIRLGAPTRELYIDGEFYEAHFGGPPVQINLDGLPYLVQLEGPPPQVKIGKKRTDLICGRINMIVDATAMLPLYLDAKPQRFDLKSRPYVFRLVDNLKTLLVNEVPVDIQFGGGCRQICGYGNLHFLRLSVLPNGIEPGKVQIVNMESIGLTSVKNVLENTVLSGKNSPPTNNPQTSNISSDVSIVNSGVDSVQQQQSQQSSRPTGGGALDILTSLMSGTDTPEQSIGFNYQVEKKDQPLPAQSPSVSTETEVVTTTQPQPVSTIPLLGSGLNINDLFQRLVASGIVPTLSTALGNNQKAQTEVQVKPIDFSDTNSLRERQPPIINSLYSGIQCSSCGVRFSPEETLKYSRHLDWHFRQNRRDKDAARKGQSRKWYYDVSDWIQFEEIEDLEERAQSWFETEATTNGDENVEQEEIKSVPAPSGQGSTLCELCRDEFETFYNEEKEEWHLKPCIKVEGKYYHPLCYEDLSNIPEDSLLADKSSETIIEIKDSLDNVKISIDKEDDDIKEVKESSHDDASIIAPAEMEECLEIEIKRDEEVKENAEEIISSLLNELINCIEFKAKLELEEEEEAEQEESQEEEIEVLESVPVAQKKNIIAVDLIEKLDDDDDIIYHRKTPSPIVLIPPAKIKQEPVEEMESAVAVVDQTYTNVVSSIDGNVEMIDTPQVAPSAPSRIKITFNKPIPTEQTEKTVIKTVSEVALEEADPDPLPLRPKKPRIAEREMTVYLPCVRGTEVSGLCSIM